MADDDIRAVTKMGSRIQISDELLAQANEDRRAHQTWLEATVEQREQWRQEAAQRRAAERANAERVIFTLTGLLERLGWTHEYAHHLLQPYCTCEDTADGWDYCDHARDLGLVP